MRSRNESSTEAAKTRRAARRLFLAIAAALTLGILLRDAAQAATPTPSEVRRVHILLVIDTQGNNSQALGLDLDGANVHRVLAEKLYRQRLTQRCTLKTLSGPDVTPDNVLAYYRTLKTGPSDGLLFYYTGHGQTTKEGEHALYMNGGQLKRADLRAAMALRKPRLLIVLTDCCASYEGATASANSKTVAAVSPGEPIGASVLAPARPGQANGTTLRDLLFRHQGVVDINAVRTGDFAYGNRTLGGSFFTVALTSLLAAPVARFDTNHDRFVEWREFFPLLQRGTREVAARGGLDQVPMAFSLARP